MERRYKDRNHHHLVPRSRCPHCSKRSNIILFGEYRHVAWHQLFGNLTLDEVIKLLQRAKRIKEAQDGWEG